MIQVVREVSGFQVQEIQSIDYPFFVDIRPDGMDRESPIVSNLSAVTLNWASPLTLNAGLLEGKQVTTLLQSSPDSWLKTEPECECRARPRCRGWY